MNQTTRRGVLKTLVGGGAAATVTGFPFVNRLALGQSPIKLGVVVPQTGPMALEAKFVRRIDNPEADVAC